MPDSDDYQQKKAFYDRVLTVYGRKPVLEAMQDRNLQCHALHLADSNREAGIVRDIRQLAETRGIPLKIHSRQQLSRISRNGKQDQGVALDILCPAFKSLADYLEDLPAATSPQRLLALDGITNPQNLGMIVRSAVAGGIDGIIWSRRGNSALGPLVIKASAGTLYRAPLLQTPSLIQALLDCRDRGVEICTLDTQARQTLFAHQPGGHCVYVLGNESDGVSTEVSAIADNRLSIPMGNDVESLNVAVTASLIAYAAHFER